MGLKVPEGKDSRSRGKREQLYEKFYQKPVLPTNKPQTVDKYHKQVANAPKVNYKEFKNTLNFEKEDKSKDANFKTVKGDRGRVTFKGGQHISSTVYNRELNSLPLHFLYG